VFGICFPKQFPCNYSAALSSNSATHTVLNHRKKLHKADARATVNIVQRKVEVDLAHDVGAAAEFVERGEVTEVLRIEFDAMEHDGAPEEGVHDLPDGGVITDPAEVGGKTS
jgi:hypothetical protein